MILTMSLLLMTMSLNLSQESSIIEANEELQSLIESYTNLPSDSIDCKKEKLERIAAYKSLEAGKFLRNQASDDPLPEIQVFAFKLWVPEQNESKSAEFLLDNRSKTAFVAYIDCLKKIPGVDALNVLKVLDSKLEEGKFKIIVARSIGELETTEAFDYLLSNWEKCKDTGIEMDILKIVLSMPDARNERFLEKLVRSNKAYARYYGIRKLLALFPNGHIPTAEHVLKSDKDDRVRIGSLQGLAQMGTVEAVRAIYMGANEQSSCILENCRAALSEIPSEIVRSGIPDTWYETSSRERFLCAALALAPLGDRGAIKHLKIRQRSSPWQDVRVAAAYALFLLGERIDGLLRMLSQGNERIRWERLEAIQALGIEDDAVIEKLVTVIQQSKHIALRVKAVQVLGSMESSVAEYYVLNSLQSADRSLRLAAIRALGNAGGKKSIPVLINRFEQEGPRLSGEIGFALHRITGRNFGPNSDGWQRWWMRQEKKQKIERNRVENITDFIQFEPDFKSKLLTSKDYAFYGLEIAGGPRGTPDNTIFVLDCSGSMTGPPLTQLKRKFLYLLESIGVQVRWNVIVFRNSWEKWKENLVPITDKSSTSGRYSSSKSNKESLKDFVANLYAGGATNLFDALFEAMSDDAVERIIVLSDGCPNTGSVDDPDVILERVRWINRTRQIAIDTIAIGGADKIFLEELARQNGGSAVYCPINSSKVQELLSKTRIEIPDEDRSLPYQQYPMHCRAVMALFNGDGEVDSVISDIDSTMNNVVDSLDYRGMKELLILRKAAKTFSSKELRRREMAFFIFNKPTWCSRLFHNIDAEDNLTGVLNVLYQLWDQDPDKFAEKYELCLAFSLVWDQLPLSHWSFKDKPQEAYDYRKLYQFYLDESNGLEIVPGSLPCELNIFVVGTCISNDERKWCLEKYKARVLKPAAIYESVPLSIDKRYTLSPAHDKGGDTPYTLENIKEIGGSSMDRAYFAENICRVFGIPSIFMMDRRNLSGVGHAWVGVLYTHHPRFREWRFDAGRRDSDCYYEGKARDPTDFDKFMTDSEIKLTARLWNETGNISKIEESNFFLDAAIWVRNKLRQESDEEDNIRNNQLLERALLHKSIEAAKFNLKVWKHIFQLSENGELVEADAYYWAQKAIELIVDKCPDYTIDIINQFAGDIRNPTRRTVLIQLLYNKIGKRNSDLMCKVKLIEGKSWISRNEIKKGIECFLYPVLNLTENKTILDIAMDNLQSVESNKIDRQIITDSYKQMFDATESKSYRNRTYSEIRRMAAERLVFLLKEQGDQKEAARYRKYLRSQ